MAAPAVLLSQLGGPVGGAVKAVGPSGIPQVHRSLSVDSQLSSTFVDGPDGRPAAQEPDKEVPVNVADLPALSLDVIAATIRSDNWLGKFLQDSKEAHSISMTPWVESKQTPGVLVRKGTFTLPVPQDFPSAVSRLVSLPEETSVTAVFRLTPGRDSLVLTVQFCNHDVPFGANFRVHETVVFKSEKEGASAEMYVEVMWVKSLPWGFGILQTVIDSKSKADGLGTRIVNNIKGA